MTLQPSIASYSGETAARIRAYLTCPVLEVVASVAACPKPAVEVERNVLAELQEMHVLGLEAEAVRLDTAVFLEPDIERIVPVVRSFAAEVAHGAVTHGAGLAAAGPEVTCFLGGVIGLGQGVGAAMEAQGVAGEWKSYQGRYACSKVDFDEVCPAREALGPDLLNKSVLRGPRYTAVVIGPEQRVAAQDARLQVSEDVPQGPLVTREIVEEHWQTVERLSGFAASYYTGKLAFLADFLGMTAAGRQGVSAANQMMHLFRYIRRATATELYDAGFLTDAVPDAGAIAVYYENDIPYLSKLL
jgi:hypothetical protein